jgi:hypothetical protein
MHGVLVEEKLSIEQLSLAGAEKDKMTAYLEERLKPSQCSKFSDIC